MNDPKAGEIWKVPFHGMIMYFGITTVRKEALLVYASELTPFVVSRKYFDNPLAVKVS